MTERRLPPPGAWSLSALAGAGALLLLVAAGWLNRDPSGLSLLWDCPWKLLTGLPCPTCGITHVFLLLADGDVIAALTLAPLPFALVLGALGAGGWFVAARLLGRPGPDEVLAGIFRHRIVWLTTVVSVFALWGYAIARSLVTGAP